MTIALIFACVVLTAALVMAVRDVLPWRAVTKRTVLVTAMDEQTVRGVLLRRSGPLLTIANAEILVDGGFVPADGRIVIERARVLWIQVAD